MKIEKVIIKDIEIVLGDEGCSCGGNCECAKNAEEKGDTLVDSLSGLVEIFSDTITEFLKDELTGKKKQNNIAEIFDFKKSGSKKENKVKEEKVSEVKVETPPVGEVPVEEVIQDAELVEETADESVESEKEETETVNEIPQGQMEEQTEPNKIKIETPREEVGKASSSSELNDFINKILNSMPNK